MNTKFLLSLFLSFTCLVAACTQPSVPSPTATATSETASPTEMPTLAPSATAEPTVAPTESVPLTATAEPAPEVTPTEEVNAMLVQNGEGQNAAWSGIGRLNASSTCTASFIVTSTDESAPAYALSNGHCIEWQANGVVTLPEYGGELVFNYFVDTQETQISVPIKSVPYSTMQGFDVAFIELDATIGELKAQGLVPLAIADTPLPVADGEVFVIGAPSSGLPQEETFLRLEHCRLAGQVNLIEFNWHFDDTYRNSCQDIFGGSSGSPLFSAEDNTIAAVINTTVEGISACYLGVPCELSADGARPNPGNSYAIPVHGLANCFNESGEFALTDDCPLPPVEQLTFDSLSPLGQPPLTWATTLTGTLPYYRYKTGSAGDVDCRSAENYSDPIALSDAPVIDDAIPAEEGFYLLCVLAGQTETIDDTWQSLDHPTVMIAEIDTTPPLLEPQVLLRDRGDAQEVNLIFDPPELSDYIFKFGAPDTIDCADEADYQRFRRIPPIIENDQLPAKLCVIAYDNAGNPTEPLEQLISADE